MSEGCPSCTGSGAGLDIAFENAKTKAGELSEKEKIPVAIYKENGEWKWENAFTAYQRGIGTIIRDVVSKHIGDAS